MHDGWTVCCTGVTGFARVCCDQDTSDDDDDDDDDDDNSGDGTMDDNSDDDSGMDATIQPRGESPFSRIAADATAVELAELSSSMPFTLEHGTTIGDISASFDTMEQLRFGKKVRGPRASTSGDFPIDITDLPSTTPRKAQLQPLDHRGGSTGGVQSLVKLEPLGEALGDEAVGVCVYVLVRGRVCQYVCVREYVVGSVRGWNPCVVDVLCGVACLCGVRQAGAAVAAAVL